MKSRRMLLKSSSASTTFGRRRLRSSAAWHRSQTKKTIELEVPSFLLEAVRQGELPRMGLRSIISHVKRLKTPRPSAQQWFEAMRSCLSSENALLTS